MVLLLSNESYLHLKAFSIALIGMHTEYKRGKTIKVILTSMHQGQRSAVYYACYPFY